jgi:hypothetical protein
VSDNISICAAICAAPPVLTVMAFLSLLVDGPL